MALIEIGRIVRPQGVKGQIKALSYLEDAAVLAELGEVSVGGEKGPIRPYPLLEVRSGKGCLFLRLGGVTDRETAQGLVGSGLWIPRGALEELPAEEYYWQDLIGLKVLTEEGAVLGRVEAIFPTGSNDVYVCREGKREILLPAIGEVVLRVDPREGVMVVRLLEGLVE